MEDKKKTWYGILSAVILILISLIFWEMPTWNLNAADLSIQNLGPKIVAIGIFLIAFAIIFFTGYDKAKREYEGRSVNYLKEGKKYKVLCITDGLKKCGEHTYLLLHEVNDVDDVIIYEKNGCWLPKDLRSGSIITQKGINIVIVE
jgi:hypothetical protein